MRAMTRDAFTVSSETPVALAADQMRAARGYRALVIDKDTLVGIVTTTDIAANVSDHRLTADRSLRFP